MLPYLKNKMKKAEGISMVVHRASDDPDAEAHRAPMDSAASDIIQAIESKDCKALADALKAAFAIMESEPHEEASLEDQE